MDCSMRCVSAMPVTVMYTLRWLCVCSKCEDYCLWSLYFSLTTTKTKRNETNETEKSAHAIQHASIRTQNHRESEGEREGARAQWQSSGGGDGGGDNTKRIVAEVVVVLSTVESILCECVQRVQSRSVHGT